MKDIIKTNGLCNGKNHAVEKELVSAYSVIGKINGELREVVVARAYMGRSRNASTVYASIWVHGGDIYCSGHGRAGGHGYHKESAAFDSAIRSADIELYGDPSGGYYDDTPEGRKAKREDAKKRCRIHGVGSDAMRLAFEAIARAAGAKGKLLFVSH